MKRLIVSEIEGEVRLPLPSGEAVIWVADSSTAGGASPEDDISTDNVQPNDSATITIRLPYSHIYGLGERFDAIDHYGCSVRVEVKEKFCEQGEHTYCTIPFFFTDSGLGFFTDTRRVTEYSFFDEISCTLPYDAGIYLFTGSPDDILSEFLHGFGEIPLPPREAFGSWVSANHWSREADVDRVLAQLDEYDFPATVLVLEAWSDEATFYIWNGARYEPREDGVFSYDDFDFSESPWSDPRAMIERLKNRGIATALWQIPVYKGLEDGEENEQNRIDAERAKELGLCVRESGGQPYRIPEGNWFAGSMIPDFTNEATRRDWMARRQYLLDIGVAGFKTDGGEFIYRDDLNFANGDSGREQKNAYCQNYINTYSEAIGEGGILFSRAGYSGAQYTPMLWAGDHKSTWEELRACYNAAITAACSGIIFWGFDIGGFAGELPSGELYLRSTQLACFCPVMQWHSEPDGGQFADILPGVEGNNERSPWNIAAQYGDEGLLDELRFWHKLRMRLLPYIYEEAARCAVDSAPLMRPAFFEAECEGITDEYYFGRALLVAPILHSGTDSRKVYLPSGCWTGLFSGRAYDGAQNISSEGERYPVYVRADNAKHVLGLVSDMPADIGKP